MKFNEFNTNNTNQNMTAEEERTHKNFFSNICLSILAYIAISEILAILVGYLSPELFKTKNNAIIISSVIQYLIAFPIFWVVIKRIPVTLAPSKAKLSLKELIKYLSITTFLMYIGTYISLAIMSVIEERLGIVPENAIDSLLTETDYFISIVIVGILGPIIEEMIFRKLLIDRLFPYGEKIAILFPSLIFGLIHGNLYQFFYAFLIGMALSYIYVKTGKAIYTIVIHCFINLFFGVFASYAISFMDVEKLSEALESEALLMEYLQNNISALTPYFVYIIIFYALLLVGLFQFNRRIFRLQFEKGKIVLPMINILQYFSERNAPKDEE